MKADSFSGFIRQGGGEVTLARAAANRDDEFASILGPRSDLKSGPDIGSGGNADQQAFLESQAARGIDRLLIGHLNDFIDNFEIQVLGDKARASALNFVGA